VKKYLNKQDGKMPFYTEKITLTLPEEKKMGLTRPKLQQMEKKPKLKDNDFIIGMIKSAIRIGACYMLYTGNIEMAAVTFGIAEFAGIGNRLSR
jgi:hypothetical protein